MFGKVVWSLNRLFENNVQPPAAPRISVKVGRTWNDSMQNNISGYFEIAAISASSYVVPYMVNKFLMMRHSAIGHRLVFAVIITEVDKPYVNLRNLQESMAHIL